MGSPKGSFIPMMPQKQLLSTLLKENILIEELLGAEILSQGDIFSEPRAYWSDSRRISSGDAFFALPGKNSDGHSFLQDAFYRGAGVVFMEKGKKSMLPEDLPKGCKIFLVHDVEKALHILGVYAHARLPLEKTLAITGSVGKTTTKNLLQTVLNHWYPSYCTRESFNTAIGIDLSLLSAPENAQFLLLEFGANSFGEIRDLTLHYKPEIGIITDVALAHTEGFSSLEGVLKAKLELTESPNMETVFFNADTAPLASFFASPKSFSFRPIPVGWCATSPGGIEIKETEVCRGTDEDAPFVLRSKISLFGEILNFKAPFYCDHHAYACAYALGVAKILGISFPRDLDSLFASFRVPSGRGNLEKTPQGILLFDESYNANPKSMESSLRNFQRLPFPGRKILVLGGMKELGALSGREHMRIFSLLSAFQKTFLLGEEWDFQDFIKTEEEKDIIKQIKKVNSIEEASQELRMMKLGEGDALFVKGSRSYGLESLVKEFYL